MANKDKFFDIISHCCLVNSGNPIDCSPPGSSFHGIFQARVLEWGAILEQNREAKTGLSNV